MLALGALALVAAAAAVILFVRGAEPPGPEEALDPFVAAWTRGDDRGAAAFTTDPRAAAAALAANRRGLDGARVQASVGRRRGRRQRPRDRAHALGRARYRRVELPHAGRAAAPRRALEGPLAPALVHPRLTATRRLGTVRDPAARAPILDRDRRTLVSARAVVRVGIDRATVSDIDATATALAGVVDVDGAALARAARRAGPKQFVEALTLRASDYAPLAARVQAIQGVQAVQGTAQLAPSRSFARALLGGVGPATAEQIKRSKGKLAIGDDIGQWGLEARYQDQLGGDPRRRRRRRRRGPAELVLVAGLEAPLADVVADGDLAVGALDLLGGGTPDTAEQRRAKLRLGASCAVPCTTCTPWIACTRPASGA